MKEIEQQMLVRQHYLLPEENAKSPRAKIIKLENGAAVNRVTQ